MLPYQVKEKIIVSGLFIEHYKYEKPYWVNWPRERRYRQFKARERTSSEQIELRDDNVRRTRIKIRRLVNSNQDLVKFMTLTFGKSFPSLDEANPIFRNFVKRITRIYPQFKYLCVPEFQSDVDYYGRVKPLGGSVHYHLLCNLPFINSDELKRIWGNGFAFIRKVDNVDNLGAYVCKYLGKANFDKRYFKKKKFFYSYNLLKPIIVDNFLAVKNIIKNLPFSLSFLVKKVFAFDFLTKYLGEIQYRQYKLSEYLKVV